MPLQAQTPAAHDEQTPATRAATPATQPQSSTSVPGSAVLAQGVSDGEELNESNLEPDTATIA